MRSFTVPLVRAALLLAALPLLAAAQPQPTPQQIRHAGRRLFKHGARQRGFGRRSGQPLPQGIPTARAIPSAPIADRLSGGHPNTRLTPRADQSASFAAESALANDTLRATAQSSPRAIRIASTDRSIRHHSRRASFLSQNSSEIDATRNQSDVTEGLREVAQKLAARRVNLFGQQTEFVRAPAQRVIETQSFVHPPL